MNSTNRVTVSSSTLASTTTYIELYRGRISNGVGSNIFINLPTSDKSSLVYLQIDLGYILYLNTEIPGTSVLFKHIDK